MGLLKFRNLILITFLAVILLPKIQAACDENIEFECADGTCIPLEDKCNSHEDCSGGEDEENCEVNEECDGFICDDGKCIESAQRCDQNPDCSNGEDEEDCNAACTADEYTCKSGQCIPQLAVCDGAKDCSQGDDELNCECARNEFKCIRGGLCIPTEQKCDGSFDCPDESDEYSCQDTCSPDEFQCGSNECVSSSDRCNGYQDCSDNSDEQNCQECGDGAFHCRSSQECIPDFKRCDENIDCNDRSDEEGCDQETDRDQGNDVDDLDDRGCGENQWQCANGECINSEFVCDDTDDCVDKSDEDPETCDKDGNRRREQEDRDRRVEEQGQQERQDAERRVQEERLRVEEERRRQDEEIRRREYEEQLRRRNQNPSPEFDPRNQDQPEFDREEESNRENDIDYEDRERDPDDSDRCREDEFYCGGQCIERERVCDGRPDCVDYSDELNCTKTNRPAEDCPEDQCNDGTCIYQYQRCDGVQDCRSGEDEHGCPCRDNEFRCNDGSCIRSDLRCNRQYDCADGSDERDCSAGVSRQCRPGEFQCSTGECISESRRCDRKVDCRDGSDENECQNEPRQPERRPPTDNSQIGLNLKTYPNEQTIKERLLKEGREVVFQCRDEGPIRARVHWVRKNNRPLPPGTRDINGRLEIPNIQMDQGGEYICEAVGYPRSTPGSSVSVFLTVEKYVRTDPSTPTACGINQATCMNGDCIAKSAICDGVFDCTDGSDENSCSAGRCEPNEFKCNNRKCVLKTWRCDGENDCGDGSDEEGCSSSGPSSGPCRYDEFQCANRQCIPKSFQCDSQSDCSDNSDEIGCIAPAVITPPPPMVRLQAGVVFNITCRATGNPIPLIVWRLNWGHIPEKCRTTSVNGFGTLTCPDIQPIDSGAYSCEIINTMGTHFVSPDTILVVTGPTGSDVCKVGQFNNKAIRPEECISCFCFGVSTQCKSADLFSYTLNPPVTSQTVVGVDGPWNGLREISVGEYDRHTLTSSRHGVQFRASDIPAASNRVYPYLALPNEYHGNQLKSYGGFLRYDVEFSGRGASNDIPDVIMQGNGYTLTYRAPNRLYPNSKNNITVQLFANNWYKLDGSYASREEIMMTLADVENILIKLQYIDGAERNVELLHVTMDSAALRDVGLGSASFVEECRCPAGYAGLSCESCDVGYVRQKTGPWLGRCVPEELCRPGTYGDPARGIPCLPCPCPVAGQSRARTCQLERNGDVTCNCDRGYIGRRCEECAPGFIGNPLSSRGCYPGQVSQCNPYGTERELPNGRCECKPDVVGQRCDQCSSGSYHLNPRSGCINCFCMGVTNQCTSSSLFRDSVRASFASQGAGFSLVSGYDDPTVVTDRLSYRNQEIAFSSFDVSEETYYWSLPPSFLGNKLTSYGGNLTYTVRYTPQPSGGASRSNSPDVVIVSANEITLHHYRQDSLPPSGAQTFVIPVYEDSWQHFKDGTSANRQHLLMALANVTAIYIKATYTTVAREAGLSQVELDTASVQNYKSNERAYEVEDCTCPPGHQGLSCEDCSPGYFKGEEGLYLGLCELCDCNGHSDECDSKTGICKNCRGNTYGDNCEICLPGYFGNATSGDCHRSDGQHKCTDCSPEGTSSCDLRTRTCNCKPNVIGVRCDECREGSFGLSETNEYGCTECFCSGATKSCAVGTFFRDEMPIFIGDEEHRFPLTDREGRNQLPDEVDRNILENEISYQFNDDSSIFYWNLPARYTGNLILSYGGNLQITQRTEGTGPFVDDQDVIIKGANGISLFYNRPDYESETYSVPLIESEWQTQNRNGPRQASRGELLSVLSNVQGILVRASLRSYTSESRISDIILETAVRQRTSTGRVENIEICRCPPGYKGTSCEQCDSLYYRDVYDQSAGTFGSCKPCPCQNAESCEMGPNRRVSCRCLPDWTGEYCTERADQVTPRPPQPPPVRPPSIKVVINTPQIKIVEIGETTEFNCNAYYIINNSPVNIRWYKYDGQFSPRVYVDRGTLYLQDAQIDDSGIYICQAEIGSEIVRDNVTVTVGEETDASAPPEVLISPAIINQEENTVAELRCTATGNPEPRVRWERLDGELSRDVVIRGGYLRFNSLRRSDEGSYRCHAENNVGDSDQTIQVYIRAGARPQPPVDPRPPQEEVSVSPTQYSGEPGEEVVLRCTSYPRGRVTWTKSGAVELPRNVFVSGEELTIRYSTVDDSGRYVCNIQFPSGSTRSSFADVIIVARSNEQPPKIVVLERKYSVVQGQDFELTCESSGSPYPTIEWSINGAQFESNTKQTGNVLRILNARPENNGVYICLATNNAGSDQAATVIEVERRDPPVIEIFPKEAQKLKVGESTRLSCRASSGTPYPTITWSRRDGRPLSARFKEDYPGVITLRDATIEDTGSYECKATNIAGTITLSTTLEIQQPPTIIIEPNKETFDPTEGEELRFTCAAVGIPQPTIQIKVPEGSNLRAQPGRSFDSRAESTLATFNVQHSHAGLYECIATNEAGQDLKYVSVNVRPMRGDIGPSVNDDRQPPQRRPRPPFEEGSNEIDDRIPPRRPPPPPPTRRPFPNTDERPLNPPRPGQQSSFTVHLGERAEFNCNAEGNSMRTEWRRADGRDLPYGARIYGSQLVIENVRNDAAGAYECLATDPYTGQPITLLIAQLVVVAGPPKITFSPPMPIVVKSGEDVIIYCNATGEGPLRVYWHGDNGQPLSGSIDIRDNYLRFNRIAPADEGRYVCTATNRYGNTTKVAEVIVNNNLPIPEDPSFVGSSKEAYEGDTVSLQCSDDNPRSRYTRYEWEREDESLPPLADNRDNILVLYNIRAEDSGRYICRTYLEDGRMTHNYVDLSIKPPIPFLKLEPSRSFIKPGDSLEVECTSSVGPDVRVTWERSDNGRLPPNFEQYGNRLVINSAQKQDTGKYSCICYTDEGNQYMSEYELNVEDQPSTLLTPKVEHAEVGATVILKCNSQKQPATYSWSRQHGAFSPDIDTSSDILKLINVQAGDAGTYVCTARYNGQVVEIPTTLVVTGAIPFFPQSPRSYMKFAKLDQAYSKFNFEITFRPERPNGLILYNGQRRGGGDYISLSLVDRVPEFRYSFGDQQGILKPEKAVTLGEWHTIKVNRVRNNGWMLVDDQHPVIFPPSQKFQGLNLEEELYLGGVPKFEHIAPTASEVKEGFIGCISRLVLNERDIQMNQEALHVEGTTSCEPCADEPCQNDGVCLETQTEHGYTCVCQEGYTGKNCQVEGFKCSSGLCGVGRCGETDVGIECYCPLNRTGDRCQYIEHYNDGILSFRDGSYAAYDRLTGKKNIKFKIRPESDQDGVILYAGESDRAYGDFIAVVIKDKHIEFRYIVGGKVLPVIIRSKDPVKVSEWMDVSVGRSRAGLGYLQVDNEPQINEAKGSGRAQTLYLKTNLYLGGYDKRVVLNRGVGVTKGFQGCVAGLEIAGKGVNMIAEIRESANVQNCGHQFVVEETSSGDYEITSDVPQPSCRPGYSGRRCEVVTDVCLANEPCDNGGICTTLPGNKYTCGCTVGFTGDKCQYEVVVERSCGFRGNGYLELDRNTIANGTSQAAGGFAIMFSTRNPNGLLAWYGQNKGKAFDGEDFMALGINEGFLEFAFRHDGEESYIRHLNARVDTGERHVAIIKRTGNQYSLELDGLIEYGESRPTGKKEMILPGHVFLGGAPDILRFTGERYLQGFNGCILEVETLLADGIKLGANTISSLNVDACTPEEEEDSLGTEPPIV